MGVVTKVTKPNGSKDWVDGDVISDTELNGDTDAILTQVNGNLDADNLATGAVTAAKIAASAVTNAKVSASAAIATTKLAQTAASHSDATRASGDWTVGLDGQAIEGHSDDEATFKTHSDPGDSSSITYPDDLDTELEMIRHAIKRLAVGTGAQLVDATNQAGWFDGAVVGPNLLYNGSFLDNNASPSGWTVSGAPATQQVTALSAAVGLGKFLNLADAAGATSDGISQSLSLKASTKYLVEAFVLASTANVKLTTTGGLTGSFDDLDLTSSGTSWQLLSGVVSTDATPTALVVNINPDATAYNIGVAWVSVRELTYDPRSARGGRLLLHATSDSSTIATVESALDLSVIAPAPGYRVRVFASLSLSIPANNDTVTVELLQNAVEVRTKTLGDATGSDGMRGTIDVNIDYVLANPTPGTVYQYTLDITPAGTGALTANDHTLTVELIPSE